MAYSAKVMDHFANPRNVGEMKDYSGVGEVGNAKCGDIMRMYIQVDPETQVIQAYDVWKEKNMYGRKTMGVVRTTYLIDEEGVIVKAFGKVKAAENPAQMLKELAE